MSNNNKGRLYITLITLKTSADSTIFHRYHMLWRTWNVTPLWTWPLWQEHKALLQVSTQCGNILLLCASVLSEVLQVVARITACNYYIQLPWYCVLSLHVPWYWKSVVLKWVTICLHQLTYPVCVPECVHTCKQCASWRNVSKCCTQTEEKILCLCSAGKYHAAILTNSEDMEDACVQAGLNSGDMVHPMPFTPELHFSEFSSVLADMKNSVAVSTFVTRLLLAERYFIDKVARLNLVKHYIISVHVIRCLCDNFVLDLGTVTHSLCKICFIT